MQRLWVLILVAACANGKVAPSSSPATPPRPSAASSSTPVADGRDLPTPLVAGMFEKGTEYSFEVDESTVDELGERTRVKSSPRTVTCLVTDVVFMKELKALSSRLACEQGSPMNGVMFASRDGFWWWNTDRYIAGGFTMDSSTKAFDREPKANDGSDGRSNIVSKRADGAWCYTEGFDSGSRMTLSVCFAGGRLVDGSADEGVLGQPNGRHVDFKIVE